MANQCINTITVLGLQDAPEAFVKQLSKAMFAIDLDNLDPKTWGDDTEQPEGLYDRLAERYRTKMVSFRTTCSSSTNLTRNSGCQSHVFASTLNGLLPLTNL